MRIYERGSTVEFYDDFDLVEGLQWSSFSQIWEMYKKDPAFHAAWIRLSIFYEGLGVLVRENLLSIRFVALFFGSYTRRYWEKTREVFYEGRKVLNYPRMASETEYLYNELMGYMGRHPELKT